MDTGFLPPPGSALDHLLACDDAPDGATCGECDGCRGLAEWRELRTLLELRTADAGRLELEFRQAFDHLSRLRARVAELEAVPYRVAACDYCGATVMGCEDCPGCKAKRLAALLRLVLTFPGAKHEIGMWADLSPRIRAELEAD